MENYNKFKKKLDAKIKSDNQFYYELLLTVDTDHSAGEHPQVTSFDKATVSAIQPQWILFGFVAGTVISGVIGVILFTFPYAGKNVKK